MNAENIEIGASSILEYATKENISISTIRRRIKSGELKYKLINGKYFIYSDKIEKIVKASGTLTSSVVEWKVHKELVAENQRLKKEIIKYKEEIIEIKMLLSLYEMPPQIPGTSEVKVCRVME
ncbi:MAG: hypothetical protein HQK49_21400 [Oligoflexia bacterium]|nr:hypothetical protein [Oligoflexia bacterium]